MDAIAWYNGIALKNGGYRSGARYSVRGVSGEDVFRARLIQLLPACGDVLDAGCGHGDFTLEMAGYAGYVCGFDFAVEMIRAAERLREEEQTENVEFACATTKEPLPYREAQFDLIYSRRGPLSIIDHPRLLKSGGLLMGIHGEGLSTDDLRQRLDENGFGAPDIEVFPDAFLCFHSEGDFAAYLSASHMNPDYTLRKNRAALRRLVREHTVNGEILMRQHRIVWSARRG